MTPYKVVFDSFKDLIVRDTTFLIKNPDVNIVNSIAQERMVKLLRHAITNIMLVKDNKNFEINFMKIKDDVAMCFNEDLNDVEIDLLAYFMWQCYVEEEVVVRLQALKTLGFSDDEIKSFSPAETMAQFQRTFNSLRADNANKVRMYKSRKRDDFTFKRFGFVFE